MYNQFNGFGIMVFFQDDREQMEHL